jgi:hypothetical protein
VQRNKQRAADKSHETRLAKFQDNRVVVPAAARAGMFGSAAEVVGAGSAGTGIGGALVGGGSGSVLDRMLRDCASESTVALVDTIGRFIVSSGAGATDDRLLKYIGGLGPRASEAVSLIQNPALFP